MAISQKIIKFLETAKVKYEPIEHRIVYTAFDKAATLKVKPNLIGKTLVLKIDPAGKNLVIVLIPANKNLDKNKLKKTINDYKKKIGEKPIKNLDFVSEKLMKNKLKARLPSPGAKATGGQGVKIGAVPPFGNLFGLTTFIDRGVLKNPKIIVNSGEYNFSIKISPTELKKLVPDLITGNFSKSR